MKLFGVLVIVTIMVTLLTSKVHSEPLECPLMDIRSCGPAIETHYPVSIQCCEELKQHINCLCNYASYIIEIRDAIRTCKIEVYCPV